MNTVNTLAKLFNDRLRSDSLPDIELTNNGSLRTLANCLAANNGTSTLENTPGDIFRAVDEFATLIDTNGECADVFQAFQRVSDAFAIRVADSYNELINIKKTVSELVDKVTRLSKSRISEDPVLAATEAEKITYTKLKPIQWNYLGNVTDIALTGKICDKFGFSEFPKGNDQFVQDVLISKLPFENNKTRKEFHDVTVTKDKANKMIDAIADNVGSRINKNTVKLVVANIMTLDEAKCIKAINSIKRFASGESAEDINHMLKMVYTYNTVMPYMTSDVMDTAASTQEAIDERRSAMEAFITVTEYLCNHYRNVIWKDAIVVPGMKINTDNWDEFRNNDKQMIKSNPTLAILQYKNKVYGSDNIPVYGINGANIAIQCDQIAKEAYAEASVNTLKCNQQKKDIFRDSFIIIAGNWLRSQKKFSLEYMHTQEPEMFASAIYDSNREDSVENMFYTVILNSCHINTLTSKLHNRLRDEYKSLYLNAKDVTERDVMNADTKVVADIINEFLVDLVLV